MHHSILGVLATVAANAEKLRQGSAGTTGSRVMPAPERPAVQLGEGGGVFSCRPSISNGVSGAALEARVMISTRSYRPYRRTYLRKGTGTVKQEGGIKPPCSPYLKKCPVLLA